MARFERGETTGVKDWHAGTGMYAIASSLIRHLLTRLHRSTRMRASPLKLKEGVLSSTTLLTVFKLYPSCHELKPHFLVRMITIMDGYVAGEDKINRRTVVQRSFSLEHDNSTVCFQNYNVTFFPCVESELRIDGDSKLSTLAISAFFSTL